MAVGKKMKNTLLLVSAIYLVLGVIMIVWPDSARQVACYILGAAGIVYGLIELLNYWRSKAYAEPQGGLFVGVLSFLFGLLIILKAKTVMMILIAALGILIIADSVVKLIYTIQLKGAGVAPWKAYVIGACVALLLGAFMLFDPLGSSRVMIVIGGVFLILDGLYNAWIVLQVEKNIKRANIS